MFGGVLNNFKALQAESNAYQLGLNFGKEGAKAANLLKWSPNILGLTGGIPGDISLSVNIDLFEALEKAEGKDRDYILFLTVVTILHEFVHYGYIENEMDNDAIEEGYDFERDVYGQKINWSNYKQILDDWLKKYNEQKKKEEEANRKGKAANKLIKNFDSLEEGTYEWNGTDFVKVD